jgi:CO/xanthine dehydrogenase FAD-binding subunit
MGKTLGRLRRLPEVECFFPKTLREVFSLLKGHKGTARVIAGGTDLLPKMKRREVVPKYLIDLRGIRDLNFIKYDREKGLRIGAATTLSEIIDFSAVSKNYPVLAEAISQMASTQVRNVATIGGNLCNAVPSADTAPPLIALGGQLRLVGPTKVRRVPVEEFFKGPDKTALGPGELVAEVQIPATFSNGSGAYLKHTLRAKMDLAIVGVATHLAFDSKKQICKDVKIVLGAVAPVPMRAERAEKVLRGKAINDGLIEDAARIASEESRPIDDIRSSAEYRREMVRILTKKALKRSLERA